MTEPNAHAEDHPSRAPLLTTKLRRPRTRGNVVARARLVERLGAGLERSLTLISAPVGFGKTTLLCDWLEGEARAVATAWVSLDEDDNDPIRFLTYVAASLTRAQAGVGPAALAMLGSPHPPPTRTILTSLLNDLDDVPGDLLLVLDDYHEVVQPAVHDAVAFLLAHLPPRVHFVITTRSDPPLPLSRLRARDQLVELRAPDLLFTLEEADAFLNQVMGLDLSGGDVAALESSTEGWIAGLQLAAISVRGRHDVANLVAKVTGAHRYVVDYLVEEVLDRQSEEVRRFLLRTSILAELTGPLCDAVIERQKSATMLADLERGNLLVVPLDEERRWYRYHHLFRECLRGRLEVEEPDLVPELYRRAGEWYEQQGLVDEAIGALLAARDFDSAARLVEDRAPRLLEHGQIVVMLNRLNRLPDALVRSRPRLAMLKGWALALGGQVEAAESYLASVSQAESEVLQGQVAAVRAIVASQRADAARVVEHAGEAIFRLPPSEPFMRGLTALNLGEACILTGDVARASVALAEAAELSLQTGSLHLYTVSATNLARVELLRGRLREAERVCKEALGVVTTASQDPARTVPALGMLYAYLGHVRRELDDLDGADCFLSKALDLARQSAFVETTATACWAAAYLRLSRADALAALALIDRAIEAVQEAGLAPSRRLLLAERAGVFVTLDRLPEAESWARELLVGESADLGPVREREMLALARLRLALGEANEAADQLGAIAEQAEADQRFGVAIEALVLQALALDRSGKGGLALDSLERALVLAEPEGYVRVFADHGAPLRALLRQVSTRSVSAEYVARLLGAGRGPVEAEPSNPASRVDRAPAAPSPPSPGRPPLVEPLTSREVEVLQLMVTGASNQRIAEALTVSLGTVKAHVSHILGKLGAHSRTEGVARARALGLLE